VNGTRDLRRRALGLAGALAGLVAGACGLLWGEADVLGSLVGSLVTVANFAALEQAAGRALSGTSDPRSRVRALLWLGATSARLGLVTLALGVGTLWGGVGLRGLLVSLAVVPVAVVVAGLDAVRVG
jgi:hypothetical protein